MNARDFAQAYKRDEVHDWTPQELEPPELARARAWSKKFGQLLFDRMACSEAAIDEREAWAGIYRYMEWARNDHPALTIALEQNLSPDALHLYNENNFHTLNGAMADMWRGIIYPAGFEDPFMKKNLTSMAQYNVAMNCLRFYRTREKFAAEKQRFSYFNDEMSEVRNTFEGAAAEMDAAIVLMEITKQYPHLTVVPAPAQFEHQCKRYNADFIMYGQGQAVGVQVKTSVTDADVQAYDNKRIVLIDSKVDLGDSLVKRTSKNRYDPHVVTWAGLVCAQFMHAIPTTGPYVKQLQRMGLEPRTVMQWKMEARHLTRGIKPNLAVARQRIGERIMRHMQL